MKYLEATRDAQYSPRQHEFTDGGDAEDSTPERCVDGLEVEDNVRHDVVYGTCRQRESQTGVCTRRARTIIFILFDRTPYAYRKLYCYARTITPVSPPTKVRNTVYKYGKY